MERQTNFCAKMATTVLSLTVLCLKVFIVAGQLDGQRFPLQHLVIDRDSGDLYVGAVNRIYRLNSDLNVQSEAITGPKPDNSLCTQFNTNFTVCISPGDTSLTSTKNYNKLLVIDKQNNKIFTCGSIYQGTCEMRDLSNLNMATNFHKLNDADYTLAPNTDNEMYSAVAFVSTGPVCSNDDVATGSQNVLYVGTSNNNNLPIKSSIRVDVPVVSSHNLQNKILDTVHKNSFDSKFTNLILERDYSDKARNVVQYKAGFASGNFSYFLVIQPEHPESPNYMSKIIQICQSDCSYHSYIEIPISCSHGSITYNLIQSARLIKPGSDLAQNLQVSTTDDVLVTIFAKSVTGKGLNPGMESAVCIYTMKQIETKFKENKQSCFNGNGQLAEKEFTRVRSSSCISYNTVVTNDYCHTSDTDAIIKGTIGVTVTAAANYTGMRLTAIEMDVIDKFTVAFLGTSNGHLLRVLIKMGSYSTQYKDDVIEQKSAILRDMVISKDRNYIYVMTENQIYKKAIADCSRGNTCQECKNLASPYCGWCSLEKKCSERQHCQNYNQDRRWRSLHAWCIELNDVNPTSISVVKQINVEMTVSELPPLSGNNKYKCVFDSQSYQTDATVSSSKKVTCPTPVPTPVIPDGQDNRRVNLYIKSTETNVNFLETKVDLYNCSVHTSCNKCASSNWNCHWCVHDNKCVDSTTTCPHSDSIQINQNPQAECPRIVQITENKLLPSGVQKDVIIQAVNLPVPKSDQTGYQCWVYIDPANPLKVNAVRKDSSTIECNSYSYDSGNKGEITAPVAIVWNGQFTIPNENSPANSATVYKCSLLGPDCSSCINLFVTHTNYECKFCDNQCKYKSTCKEPVVIHCPPPSIDGVDPLSGPIQGGTLVTIRGVNLGTNFQQVQNAVTIGEIPCPAVADKYEVSTTIVCRTEASGRVMNARLQITLKINNDGETVAYSRLFHYKNPSGVTMSPVFGPKAGGTRVTITGTHLQTGGVRVIKLGNIDCKEVEITDTMLVCVTGPSPKEQSNLQVKLTFDGSDKSLSQNSQFRYTANPEVTNISPLAAYEAGGRIITVQGTDLNVIQKPLIFFQKNERREFGNCTVKSNVLLWCSTPAINLTAQSNEGGRRKRQTNNAFTVGFIMDGVQSVQNLAQDPNISSTIDIVPNPVYTLFKKKTYRDQSSLELKGVNLRKACTAAEVTVLIGIEQCIIQTLSDTILYCKPPKVQPEGEAQGKLPQVKVYVGNLEYVLGEVEYESVQGNEIWIIGVAIGGGVFLTFIIIILVVYKRKSTKAERQYKKLKMQLDTLESNVRNECKQAFAELQTEVSDFTSDISIIGIPIWDYKTYTFKVLFPSQQDHPVMHNGPEYMTNKFGGYDQGLHQFSQLLNSKHFMLIFIRTLEQQKNFGVRDKAVVASLLMIVLQDKMEYATDILKALMNELIDRSVEKKHPKLMLRRTESVVEKLLTNWLSICMYSYLKKHAGKELFMLYQAIKRQTEKGPVDAITSEARYSLSEDRLLRDKIEPKTINLNLVTDGEREPVTCKCLDCDTVTQAKQKALDAIYLNTPFSQRPSIYDIDLEWRSGKSGHLPLQDEDVTTEVIHGWKKVNTLAHYHVPDGAVMALVQKRYKSDGVRTVHGRIEITGSNGMQPIVTMEEGQKVWHLLKHDDGIYISRQQKVISEIFLTRLLATKGTLQQYIDELFTAILRVDHNLPPAIKWLFDFLDGAAKRHGIHDPDVVHTWKSNSLPLRFWVNIVKNPEFVFDIHKSHITDSCLSVIAQTFMDSCSTMEHRLGKDSPSNKLLFAKDIPRYRQWVSKYYRGIQDMPAVSDNDMKQIMTEMSLHYTADFNVSIALKELFKYAHQYNFELLESLDEDPSARKFHLANKFEEVTANLEGY